MLRATGTQSTTVLLRGVQQASTTPGQSGIAAAVHVASQWEATGHNTLTLARAVEIGVRFDLHLPAPVQDTLLQAFAATGLLFASTLNAQADAFRRPWQPPAAVLPGGGDPDPDPDDDMESEGESEGGAAEDEGEGEAEAAAGEVFKYAALLEISLEAQLQMHVPTLRDIPRCIRGPFARILTECISTLAQEYRRRAPRQEALECAWKAFVLAPRMLLHPVGLWGSAGKEELERRTRAWDEGCLTELLQQSRETAEARPSRSTSEPQEERNLRTAAQLVEQGQLSKAAMMLTSSGTAPGNADTLAQLTDPSKRPPLLTEALPPEVTNYRPTAVLRISKSKLLANLRSARRGSAPGPSGMRLEHLKPLLEDAAASDALAFVCGRYAQAVLPETVARALGLCHLTALKKDSPGACQAHGASSRVRGLAVGDVVRRLVGRTLAQQFQPEFEAATAPQQFGIASHGGVEAAVHLMRALTDADQELTITQIDGIGAYDHIRRASMLRGLADTPTAHKLLPFVMLAYGRQSTYLWTDDAGRTHQVLQGEGGEQGDALMPALFSLGMARALRQAQEQLQPGELVVAYLDDVYIITRPERALPAYRTVTATVEAVCGVRPNLGKTVVWNKAGLRPPGLEQLGEGVWRGSGSRAGIRVLGAPFGTQAFVDQFGDTVVAKASNLWEKVRALPQLQHSWLLFSFCLVPKANHLLRQVPPDQVEHTAQAFEQLTQQALEQLLGDVALSPATLEQARLPFRDGGLGLRHFNALSQALYWSSWADVLPTLHERYPALAADVLRHLLTPAAARAPHHSLDRLDLARQSLLEAGLELPSWLDLSNGAVPQAPLRRDPEEHADPGEWAHGWQFFTSSALQTQRRQALTAAAGRADKARLRSCRGRNSSRWLTAVPYQEALVLSNPVFQCLLRRRLGLSITADSEQCEARTCRTPLDAEGHHRAACMRTGRVHGRHSACIAPWRQVLHEAGYRTRAERLLRDTHVPTDPLDQRRMDIVAAPGSRAVGARRGVPLFLDVTVVAVHARNGVPHAAAVHNEGGALSQAVARKRRRYQDVVQHGGSSFVVLGCEVYGRWCSDAVQLMRELIALKARQAPPALQRSAANAWSNRWWSLVAVGTQRAVAESLLRHAGADLQPSPGLDSPPPLADLVQDYC